MTKTAEFLKDLDDFTGHASLYKLSEPMTWHDYGDDMEEVSHETAFVIVSATNAMFSGPETLVFPATEDGGISNWMEIDGSYRGGLDHATALEGAGYSIA